MKFLALMFQKEEKLFDYLSFPTACYDIKSTKTGILCVGTYKPSVKQFCFEKQNLVLERNAVTELIKCEHIEEDRFCVLRDDRRVDFYNKNGSVDSIKMKTTTYDIAHFFHNMFVATGKGLQNIDLFSGESTEIKLNAEKILFNKQQGFLAYKKVDTNKGGLFKINENEVVCEFDANAIAFDSCGNNFMFSEGNLVKEFDIRNTSEPLAKIDVNCNIVKYKDEKTKVFINDNKIYTNSAENYVAKNKYTTHACCFYNDILFIGGEQEEIDAYRFIPE